LVYPSLFEGFGLPVLEAMSQGKAVISSLTTSIPEIVSDAGLLVDPIDKTAIAQAMQSLSENPALRVELGEKARQRAQSFTWEDATQKLLEVYQAALRLPKYRIE
jgi:glycosyltransferase involved in cell wall biosynthesis